MTQYNPQDELNYNQMYQIKYYTSKPKYSRRERKIIGKLDVQEVVGHYVRSTPIYNYFEYNNNKFRINRFQIIEIKEVK